MHRYIYPWTWYYPYNHYTLNSRRHLPVCNSWYNQYYPIYTRNEEFYKQLKEQINLAITQKNSNIIVGNDISTTTSKFLIDLLLQDENFRQSHSSYKGDTGWDVTTDIPTRIILNIKITDNLEQFYPDKNQKVSIVSVGAGWLLQEYLLLRALIYRGFKNIGFSAIDPISNIDKLKTTFSLEGLEKCLQPTGDNECNILIEHFRSAGEFIAQKIAQANYKTDVCLMVSPPMGSAAEDETKEIIEGIKNKSLNEISFYHGWENIITLRVPYNITQSFLSTRPSTQAEFIERFINTINQEVMENSLTTGLENIINRKDVFRWIFGKNDIWLSFFEIIKITGTPNTIVI